MSELKRPPLPHDFHPEVPSFTVVSEDIEPGAVLKDAQVYAAGNTSPQLRWEGFPRGLAWQDGQSTLTLVGAAPTDELTQMANALPQAPLRRSLRQRLGHLVDWMKHRLP